MIFDQKWKMRQIKFGKSHLGIPYKGTMQGLSYGIEKWEYDL